MTLLGKTYEVSEGVFNPKYFFTSIYMAGHTIIQSGDRVLDMGTGSGIQAINAAARASHVTAIDINPEAAKYARINVAANRLESKITILHGDLFAPLTANMRFDVILFNPPYLEGTPKNDFEHALYDGGKEIMKRFFSQAAQYLLPGGNIQMLYSSLARHARALEIAEEHGWKHQLITMEKTVTESFMIYKLQKGETSTDENRNNLRHP